jgi:signal transduction histidine kinase
VSLASVFAALAADATALAALWKHVPAGVGVYDAQARILTSNELFTRIVGDGENKGQSASPLSELVKRALDGEADLETDAEWSTDAGQQRVHLAAIPVRNESKVVAVVVIASDGGAGAGQRETLGIVGHDLRNPLAAIRMTAQLLTKPDEMPTERRITLGKRILTSSTRMDSIVKSLLDYARAKAGALVKLEREPIDLSALAARVIEELTVNVTGRSIELRAEGDLSGQWDAGRLEQVLGHLISNALRHGDEGTSVLTLKGKPDRVEISIHSRGPAIPADLLPRLFDPFQIGPRPAGTPRRSIGLGLFIVKELVNAHDGQVSVESSDGAGTRFTVTLPRVVTST